MLPPVKPPHAEFLGMEVNALSHLHREMESRGLEFADSSKACSLLPEGGFLPEERAPRRGWQHQETAQEHGTANANIEMPSRQGTNFESAAAAAWIPRCQS